MAGGNTADTKGYILQVICSTSCGGGGLGGEHSWVTRDKVPSVLSTPSSVEYMLSS